jgi:DNA modification methylase
MSTFKLFLGDCLEELSFLPDNSVDSIVTDPPYGLSFMGKKWDYDVPSSDVWVECLRVLKPGGHLLAFAGTRTQHRMAVRIEDAGFEIRDMIAWVYGSGFPKSLDVSKAIDAKILTGGSGPKNLRMLDMGADTDRDYKVVAQIQSEPAKQWEGWGTALKPALEPITLARKPFDSTVADNVIAHGTGALNINGCRVPTEDNLNGGAYSADRKPSDSEWVKHGGTIHSSTGEVFVQPEGRWPANLIHDGSTDVILAFPQARGQQGATAKRKQGNLHNAVSEGQIGVNPRGDSGSAARFFYCPKASKTDRGVGNNHTTVKPTDLMRYLCRLVTPPGGVVLDPFMGSGSTGKAALVEGFRFVGIEREVDYMRIARGRIETAAREADEL